MVETAFKTTLIQPSYGSMSETSIFTNIACLSVSQDQTILNWVKLIMTIQIYTEMGTHVSINALTGIVLYFFKLLTDCGLSE